MSTATVTHVPQVIHCVSLPLDLVCGPSLKRTGRTSDTIIRRRDGS